MVDPVQCEARRTRAFTEGCASHFATASPDVHVAVHEAVHQLQHGGVTNDLGLGPEAQASLAADAVRAGVPARHLVGPRGRPVPNAVRHYVETSEYGGSGRLAETGEALTFGGQEAYATPSLIASANDILTARRSGVSLSAGAGGRTVDAPDGSGSKGLSRVSARMDVDPSGETLYSDCKQAAEEVMGGKGEDVVQRIYVKPGGLPVGVKPPTYPMDYAAMVIFIDEKVAANPEFKDLTEEEKLEFISDARTTWEWWLSSDEREEYRKKAISRAQAQELGIDEFATPRVGEAFAVFPEDPPAPGAFRFHFATVVMSAGGNSVTLENAGGDRDEKSKSWKMQMYGPPHRPEQTFHGQWAYFGSNRRTLRIGNQPPPPEGAGEFRSLPTRELLSRYEASTDENERYYLKQELDHRVAYAWVEVHDQEDWTGDDEVYVLFSTSFGSLHAGGAVAIPEGQSHVFTIPVRRLMPTVDPMVVDVYEFDVDGDDLIGSVSWPKPYFPLSTMTLTSGDARYVLTLSL